MEESQTRQMTWQTKVDASGRVLLPVDLRERINAPVGTEVQWVIDANGAYLKTYDEILVEIQNHYSSLSSENMNCDEEIPGERRKETPRG